jgi:hypothetical protein
MTEFRGAAFIYVFLDFNCFCYKVWMAVDICKVDILVDVAAAYDDEKKLKKKERERKRKKGGKNLGFIII